MFNLLIFLAFLGREQPPSGGCVLKPSFTLFFNNLHLAAAFGRLCVETPEPVGANNRRYAAAFGRLCVETSAAPPISALNSAAAFGRLCVETLNSFRAWINDWQPPSGGCVLKQLVITDGNHRCRAAAFGRLCVETCAWCDRIDPV